jgi:hypothetical protein
MLEENQKQTKQNEILGNAPSPALVKSSLISAPRAKNYPRQWLNDHFATEAGKSLRPSSVQLFW